MTDILDIISDKLDLIFRTIVLSSIKKIDDEELKQYFELNNKLLAVKIQESENEREQNAK